MKKLSLCLAFILILTMIPIGAMIAFAEGTTNAVEATGEETATTTETTVKPWKLGNDTFPTLAEAIGKANDNDIIYLTQDLTEAVTADLGKKSLTINGKPEGATENASIAVTANNAVAMNVSNGTLTLKNITLTATTTATKASSSAGTLTIGGTTAVTLENVTLTNNKLDSAVRILKDSTATLTVKDGTSIESKGRAGIETTKGVNSLTTLTFTMYGGEVIGGTNNYGLQGGNGNSKTNAVIYGGSIFGDRCAMTSGSNTGDLTAILYDGTFSASETSSYGVLYTGGNYTVLGGTFEGGVAILGKQSATDATIAYPEGATSLTLKPVMLADTSLRTNQDSWGIRFQSTTNADWLTHLGAKVVDYGTLVALSDTVAEKEGLTVDLAAQTNAQGKKLALKISAAQGAGRSEIDNGANYLLSAALINIADATLEYTAVTYITVQIDTETTITLYSDASVSASMAGVAANVLENAADHSYTDEQWAMIRDYANVANAGN